MKKYEMIIQAKDGKYEVEIDKATGKVLEVEKENDIVTMITMMMTKMNHMTID